MPEIEPDVVIVGGGLAGMVAGLPFARAGIETLVLEKHADFFRDFRGDTVHPGWAANDPAPVGPLLDAAPIARAGDAASGFAVSTSGRHWPGTS